MTDAVLRRPSFKPNQPRQRAPLGYVSPADKALIVADNLKVRIETKGPHMKEFIAKAKAFQAKWGPYTCNNYIFTRVIVRGDFLHEYEERAIVEAMALTKRRASADAERAKAMPYTPQGDGEISDAQVAATIRLLTNADADQATHANSKGWSSADSSRGHYCHAMLDIDYAAAIATGRTLVSKYTKQLQRGGVL